MKEQDSLVDDLEKLDFFQGVPPEIIAGVAGCSRVRTLLREEILLAPGHLNRHLFLVLDGTLRVQFSMEDRQPIAIVGRGETVGEMSIIDHDGCLAYVVAHEESRLLEMDEDMLWSLVQIAPSTAKNLLSLLTRRLRHANTILADRIHAEKGCGSYGTIDSLTGLHNRGWLDSVLPRYLSRCYMGGPCLTAIVLDVDKIAEFNEKHGRISGDRAIFTLGRILVDYLRPTEMAARYSGDRFIVLLPDLDAERAEVVADRLRHKVMNAVIVMPEGAILPSITISAGVVTAGGGESVEEFLMAADAALQRAKDRGGNCVSR